MTRQLLNAGVEVRLSQGMRLTPVYAAAGREERLGSLVGILHAKSINVGSMAITGSTNWTVSSRANQELSTCFFMDDETAGRYVAFFDAYWNNARPVTSQALVDDVAERIRVQALKMKH